MSEHAYETRPKGSADAWEPVTFEHMWHDLDSSHATESSWRTNALIMNIDDGKVVSSDVAEYRKAELGS